MFILAFLMIGLVAGFLATRLVNGEGFGFYGDLAVGVLGSFIGGYISYQVLGEAYGLGGAIIFATLGSAVLLLLGKLIRHGPTNTNIRMQ
jgi:uncharacterized membrane protein YeaQ/YmgE (transglycosylase-associated protein family)